MRRKIVIFDLDGTIIDNIEYVWKTLHEHFGVDEHPERVRTREDYFSRRITYQEWADRDIELLKKHGADRETIFRALRDARLMKGARETLMELKKRGFKLALMSGSLDVLLEKFIPDYEKIFDHVFINRIIFGENGEIKDVEATPFDMAHKKKGLFKICELEGIEPEECVFVGDHENDVEIAKAAGFSIAFNSKSEKLNEVSDVVIRKKDLREILKYLPAEEKSLNNPGHNNG